MGAAAIPIVLVFLLVFLSWRVVFSANRDLMRAKAWGPLIASGDAVYRADAYGTKPVHRPELPDRPWILTAWAATFAVAVIASNLLAMPGPERKANKSFRQGNYEEAVQPVPQAGRRPTSRPPQGIPGRRIGRRRP